MVCSCKVDGRFSKGNIFPPSLENVDLVEREALMGQKLGLQVFLLPQEASRELGLFDSWGILAGNCRVTQKGLEMV